MSKSSKIVECAVLVRTSLICCRSKWCKFLDQDKIPHFIWVNCSFSAFFIILILFLETLLRKNLRRIYSSFEKENSIRFFLSQKCNILVVVVVKIANFQIKTQIQIVKCYSNTIICTLRINFHVNLHIFSVQFKSTINITRVRVVLKRKHSFIRLVIFAVYFRYRWLSVLSWVVQQR